LFRTVYSLRAPIFQLYHSMTTLSKDQKSKVSLHGGYVLSTHFPDTLPMWKDIGTDVKQTLLKDVIERLRDHQCSDVAEYVGSRQEEALKLLQIRFKSMKDRRRAKLKKQATEHEGLDPPFVSNHVLNLIVCGS